jgi:hypothetical protein
MLFPRYITPPRSAENSTLVTMGASQSTIVIPARRPRRCAKLVSRVGYMPSPLMSSLAFDCQPPRGGISVLLPPPCCSERDCENAFQMSHSRPRTPMRPDGNNTQDQLRPSGRCFICNMWLRNLPPAIKFLGDDGVHVRGQLGEEHVDLQIGGRDECADHCRDCRMYCEECQARTRERGRSRSRPTGMLRSVRNRTPTPRGRRIFNSDSDDGIEEGHHFRRSSASREGSARATNQVPIMNSVYVNVRDTRYRDNVQSGQQQDSVRRERRQNPENLEFTPAQERAIHDMLRREREEIWMQQDRLVCRGGQLCVCQYCSHGI